MMKLFNSSNTPSLLRLFILIISFFVLLSSCTAESGNDKKWIGTWSCAPYSAGSNTPPSPYLTNNTLRQIVRVSIGGDSLRVKFSNITSSTSVTLNSVNIAVATETGGSSIDLSTLKQLRFNGNTSTTISAYSNVTSDPVAFPLTADTQLAITIYYGNCKISSDMTHHYGSRTDSYILSGDQTANADFSGATTTERWYTINTIDVLAPDTAAAIAVIGNSITDGYGLHGGLKNKWTDFLSKKLIDNPATSHVSVLNLGIGGTLVTTSGLSRYEQDILEQNGLRWIIVFYGVNDIAAGKSTNQIISAFKTMITQAHAQNIRIYGATITPFYGHSHYSEAHEVTRIEVNEWIRTSGNFDKYIDFDKIIRDPSDTIKLLEAYSNDWLHPNAAGYQLLGESVDLNLFLGKDTTFAQPKVVTHYLEPECATVGSDWETTADTQASNGYYVSVKDGTESTDAAPEGDESTIVIPFTIDTAGLYTVYARLNCPTADDDSYWVKMDNGNYAMCNGLGTDNWQWLSLQSYDLTIGTHYLTIAYREDGAKLDKIAISNSTTAPTGSNDEAENSCNPMPISEMQANSSEIICKTSPNPFKDETTISFSIKKAENVSIEIFDIKSNLIATLVDDYLASGSYRFNWNGKNDVGSSLSNGTYIYKFIAGNQMICNKLLLSR